MSCLLRSFYHISSIKASLTVDSHVMPLKYNSDSLQNLRFKFPVSWLEKQNREFTVAASEQTQLTTYFQSLFFEAFAEFFKENKTFAKQTTAFNCTGCFPSMAPNQMGELFIFS